MDVQIRVGVDQQRTLKRLPSLPIAMNDACSQILSREEFREFGEVVQRMRE
jgi:hypothetical protein